MTDENFCSMIDANSESRSQIMSQITIRQIPTALESQLRSLARKNKTSLNKVILALLMKTLGLEDGSDKKEI